MTSKKISIDHECDSCGGTGLYAGFAERKGTAVICLSCSGSGKVTSYYTPYTGRKKRAGINSISQSRGSLLVTGVGSVGESMTYAEFEKRIRAG